MLKFAMDGGATHILGKRNPQLWSSRTASILDESHATKQEQSERSRLMTQISPKPVTTQRFYLTSNLHYTLPFHPDCLAITSDIHA